MITPDRDSGKRYPIVLVAEFEIRMGRLNSDQPDDRDCEMMEKFEV
jgi:hypothetical protein